MREAVTPGVGAPAAGAALVGVVAVDRARPGRAARRPVRRPERLGARASLLGPRRRSLMIFGVALLAPVLVRPLARSSARRWSASRASPAGWRARTPSASRSAPRSPPSALMIGLALVVFIAIFAAGLRGSIDKVDRRPAQPRRADRHARGRLLARPGRRRRQRLAGRARRRRSSRRCASTRPTSRAAATPVPATGIDPATITAVFKPEIGRGRPADARRRCSDDQVLVDDDWAKGHGFKVGDTLQVTTPTGKQVGYELVGHLRQQGRPARQDRRDQRVDERGLEPARRQLHPRRRHGRAPSTLEAGGRSRRSSRLPGRQGADARPSSRTTQPTRSTSCSGSSTRCWRCR